MGTKKVRVIERIGDPSSGAIFQPGATVELSDVWADRYVAQGKAELVGSSKSTGGDKSTAPATASPEKKAAKKK